ESHRSAAADLLSLHRDIVRSLASGLLTIRKDGSISAINQTACDMLGVATKDAIGAPLETDFPELAELIGPLPAGGVLRRGELLRSPESDADRVLGVSVSPLYDHKNQVRGRVVNFQDLTEMRRMEESVKRAERLAVVG